MRLMPAVLLLLAAGLSAQPSLTPETVLHSATGATNAIRWLDAGGNGDAQIVAWSEVDPATGRTSVRWMSAEGGEVFTAPRQPDLLIHGSFRPLVAQSGDMFLVTWTDYRSFPAPFPTDYYIRAVRTDSDGRPLDAAPIAVSLRKDTHYITRGAADRFHIYLGQSPTYETQILRDGTIATSMQRLLDNPAQAAASSGKSVLFAGVGSVIEDPFRPWRETYYLYVQLQPLGSGVTQQPFLALRRLGGELASRPVVATSGNSYLVVYIEQYKVLAQMFNDNGTPISVPFTLTDDTPPNLIVPYGPHAPKAVWDGNQYVITWVRSNQSAILGATMSEAPQVASRFDIANTPLHESDVNLVSLGDGKSLVLYLREGPGGKTEILSRVITTLPGRARRVR